MRRSILQIDPYDREILRILLRSTKTMSTNEISNILRISWNTTKKHLVKLRKLGLVNPIRRGGNIVWRVNR